MPSPRHPRTVPDRSSSFHGRATVAADSLKRPRTVPNLLAGTTEGICGPGGSGTGKKKAVLVRKVLMKVSIEGCVGSVQVVISVESNVNDLILAVVKQFVKEGRRPLGFVGRVQDFDLHYSQFSLDSLDREEKLATLGSRNFFMCKRLKAMATNATNDGGSSTSSCSKQAGRATKLNFAIPWLKFMNFLF